MATIWVDSAATGLADGTSYADAYTTLGAATAVDADGDDIYLVYTHSENLTGSTSYTFNGSSLHCVNSSGIRTVPTSNNITTSANIDVTIAGTYNIHDLWLSSADDITIIGTGSYIGGKITPDTLSSGWIKLFNSTQGHTIIFKNVLFNLGAGYIEPAYYGVATFDGCQFTGSETTLFQSLSFRGLRLQFNSCDFSAHTMTNFTASPYGDVVITVNRCLFAPGIIFNSGSISDEGSELLFFNGTVGDNSSYFLLETAHGTVDEETGIYRTAGATSDGSANFSSQVIAKATAKYRRPLKVNLSNQYINTSDYTTDVTFTVHFAVDGSTVALNDDEFWMEVEHVDGADNALGVLVNNKAAPLDTATAPTTETGLWTGLGGTNKQMSISKTVTIGTTAGTIASGLVRVNVYVGKASQTVFICPQVEVS